MPHDHAPAPSGVVPLVEVTRGRIVESRHFGVAAVVDAGGHVVAAWGDVEQPVYPRSSIKMIQALPMLETGAADAFALTDAEVAIACASHSGSDAHLAVVAGMLGRIGLDEQALACGPRRPGDEREQAALARAGAAPRRIHNCCSGKHAGMLLTARHIGAPTDGYQRPDHPVQQRVVGAMEQMTGLDLFAAPRSADGCSLPIWALPLGNLALAMARIADPHDQPDRRQQAITRLWQAQAAAPEMVDGAGGFVTETIRLAAGGILVKNGAEGVQVGVIRAAGLGLAVKVADGADRAAQVAMAALLLRFAEPGGALRDHLERAAGPAVKTFAGEAVGEIRPAPDWLAGGVSA
ncbi:MAG: asparaginase [Alphaproteobacteria bacterium]